MTPKKTPEIKKTNSKSRANQTEKSRENENLRLKEEIKTLKKGRNVENTFSYNFMPYIMFFLGVFVAICFIIPDYMGFLGKAADVLRGLLSVGAPFISVCMILHSFFWKNDIRNNKLNIKFIINAFFVLNISAIMHLFYISSEGEGVKNTFFVGENNLYLLGQNYVGGGVIGGAVAGFFHGIMNFGAWIVLMFSLVILTFSVLNITPADMIAFVGNKFKEWSYNAKMQRKQRLQKALYEENAHENEAENAVQEENAPEKRKKPYLLGLDEKEKDEKESENAKEKEEVPIDAGNEENGEISEISSDALKMATGDMSAAANAGKISPDKDIFNGIKDKIKFYNSPQSEEKAGGKEINLAEIFTEDAVIASAGVTASTSDVLPDGSKLDGAIREINADNEFEGEKEPISVLRKPSYAETYKFPPINFLKKDPNPATFLVTEELKQTSVKLVETLANFGVKTKITNICCGPTVTRYELQPEIGVRVKSIQNLSDDIALHLAAAGVRIEAPIPGKEAVGIEIPNKKVSTVYIRDLIENEKFEQLKSKLSVCLGMDVAGSPVYMDMAKMPHLLIAGATGMGKSVCLNSFIVSVLYKSRPDECKLILIDPKKVELGVYNGIPHLLVPVVSDPKKAAGSLSWAVMEMERRFRLIEEVGVRDIDGYNNIIKNDPEKETLPKILIIIDELADLMMTARDAVETSICRIAQKARAAGMHLVIGTQRPSVDVITGLIKANVPSRIAFTVASQVDSRTIIDTSGAEKLLGRGDMLYAPVGSMKPMRVQGSFVSEGEIEEIISFLKSEGEAEYDNDIIDSIDREAERCTDKKGRAVIEDDAADSEDRDSIIASDDAILPAIEIAVEAKMLSTSLLQRKLSLGYSRAARIVDKLEKLGVVGPFEGSKPRKVLITREEYLEMKMNQGK